MQSKYDVIVMGAGPAGSAAAALTAEAGCQTLLVEREKMPRFHVGESLMPEVYWSLERLGVLEQVKHSDYVRKVSVQFVSHTGKESQPFFFPLHDPRECSRTWQVERSQFDQMLFENAAAKGADCNDQTRVTDIVFDDDRAVAVRLQQDGESHTVEARVIVDATGQHALLANRLGIRDDDPNLRKAAIWSYFKGARREPGEHGGGTVILKTRSKACWFWFIPLADDITSIGVVADNDYLLKNRGKPADTFAEELADCPGLAQRLENASPCQDFRVAKEFSYSTQRQAGDGWVLIGDALGFIDPIYSSGVYLALKSGELAADAIAEGLARNDTSAAQLGNWLGKFQEGTHWIRKLVDAYYTDGFSFGRFLRDYPQHQGNLTDLLIGRVFQDNAGRIFDDMDQAISRTRS